MSFSASIQTEDGANLSLSGTALLPGYEHSDPPVGKQLSISIYGDSGCLVYSGDDQNSESGRLEFRTPEVTQHLHPELGFQFENTELDGIGPESVLNFVNACLGNEYFNGADSSVGLRTVQIVEAMYRSNASGKPVEVEIIK